MSAVDTYLLLRAFCDELARCGMRHACTSPGSRNTPILLSLAREPGLRCWSHLDERCAGFFALGAAKASGRPVAVTCTSGTAAANLAPAVIEARWARVPLLVLTADRPPELREVGAGQTIDQLKLFGDAPKWFFEVQPHDADPARLRWIRQLACRAYWTAATGPPGPVHLNFPFREPLVLDEPLPADPVPGRSGGAPWVILERPGPGPAIPAVPPNRAVVVAGAGADSRLPELAAAANVPLLADPLSGARRGPAAIRHYDLLLRHRGFVAGHRPQTVIRAGDLPTSKPLRTWLAGLTDVVQVALDPDLAWHDPDAVVSLRCPARGFSFAEHDADSGWLTDWCEADATVAGSLCDQLVQPLSEPLVAARLGEWLPSAATLFVASSMPIRDVEEFSTSAPHTLSNRGANGIDGTVSSAFGVAAATGEPVVLLIGDVALLHDLGGLMAGRRLGLPLVLVVLNNDGGGIFHFLPVSSQADAFEEHVATPHGIEFAAVAALYGCGYERPVTGDELHDALSRALACTGVTIVEVRTDRADNLALHRRLEAAAMAALEDE